MFGVVLTQFGGRVSGPSPKLKEFVQRWAITTFSVLVAEWIVDGIRTDNVKGLLVATLLLGTFNTLLRPLLVATTVGAMAALNAFLGLRFALLTLPLQIVLFGFLLLTISAVLLLVVDQIVGSFYVDGFWPAFWGGVVISLCTLILNSFTRTGNTRVSVQRGGSPPRPGLRRERDRNPNRDRDGNDGPGSGPVIDV